MTQPHPVLEPGAALESQFQLRHPALWRIGDPEPPGRHLYIMIGYTDALGQMWTRLNNELPRRDPAGENRGMLAADRETFSKLILGQFG